MKVIDLLNKIANKEEIPKEIGYSRKCYYLTNNHDIDEFGGAIGMFALNDEIEILDDNYLEDTQKEDKKIPEKLDYCEENTFMIKCKENSYLTREEIRLLDSNFKELGNKINSIIDYLKIKGE